MPRNRQRHPNQNRQPRYNGQQNHHQSYTNSMSLYVAANHPFEFAQPIAPIFPYGGFPQQHYNHQNWQNNAQPYATSSMPPQLVGNCPFGFGQYPLQFAPVPVFHQYGGFQQHQMPVPLFFPTMTSTYMAPLFPPPDVIQQQYHFEATQPSFVQIPQQQIIRPRQKKLSPYAKMPMAKVNQKHVDNDTKCTTCLETFNLGEEVAKLNCVHIFHRPCIVPWLKRSNTCPICRDIVDPAKW